MSTHKGKILFVDDDKDLCITIKDILEDFGFQVTNANSCTQAIDILKQETFDVIMTDLVMESKDSGLDLCKDINLLYPNIPVIIITGFPSFSAAALAISVGAHDFLTKPFELDDVLATINGAMNVRSSKVLV